MKVLLVEDDDAYRDRIRLAIEESGHSVVVAADGEAGVACAKSGEFDVIVADRMMPKMDGLTMISTLRSSKIEVPVLVLSALGQVDDRVTGLRAGGDDYLTKPCAIPELLARIEVLGRRRAPSSDIIESGSFQLSRIDRTARCGEQTIDLNPREYKLLEFLVLNEDRVVTRSMLFEHVWGLHFDPGTNVIDVHISRLRSKLSEIRATDEELIHTIRGVGYRFAATTNRS